jgi:hypothetical protein
LENWTVENYAGWLKYRGIDQRSISLILYHKIDGRFLEAGLTAEHLAEMAIPSSIERTRILAATALLIEKIGSKNRTTLPNAPNGLSVEGMLYK